MIVEQLGKEVSNGAEILKADQKFQSFLHHEGPLFCAWGLFKLKSMQPLFYTCKNQAFWTLCHLYSRIPENLEHWSLKEQEKTPERN